jgi:hypothetical protein
MGNDDDFSRPIRVPTDDPAEQAEIRRRIKAGDVMLFFRVILTLCSTYEQRAKLEQRLLQRDGEGLIRVALAIVAKECGPDVRWAFDGGAAPFRRSRSRGGGFSHRGRLIAESRARRPAPVAPGSTRRPRPAPRSRPSGCLRPSERV